MVVTPSGIPLQFPSAFSGVHGPIPVDQHTHEGRYLWDPRLYPFHHGTPGLPGSNGSPTYQELSMLQRRGSFGSLDGSMHLPYRLSPYHLDPMYAHLQPGPPPMPPLGPLDSRGLPLHHPEYLQQMAALGQRCLLGDCSSSHLHADSHMASPEAGSHLASPRPRHGRKRPLSSPYLSDSLDLSSVIRFSPNSLASYRNGSRSSSASGSYGHLSAGALSPAMGLPQTPTHFHPFMRQPGPMMMPPAFAQSFVNSPYGFASFMAKAEAMPDSSGGRETACNIVSSTVDGEENMRQIKKELLRLKTFVQDDDKETAADLKEEPDFIETNCHWVDCKKEFMTQEELVKHINDDHIHQNRKQFVCRWKECSREEKPFKAQYMLVVHMRRHTGEKPHRCKFEGCSKAYSRLENLKTHLRSHTGEKPYTCEYPGCTKAFSNASDRAKHQNRTHSNAKPYECKAPGCNKRYTDPSSLRKHVKNVHGADFYANKKHKGGDSKDDKDNPGDDPHNDQSSMGGSPNSDNSIMTNPGSLSSPSIKSEGSPPTNTEESVDESGPPISDSRISTTSRHADHAWDVAEIVEEALEEESIALAPCAVGPGGDIKDGGRPRIRFKKLLNLFPSNIFPKRGSLRRDVEPASNYQNTCETSIQTSNKQDTNTAIKNTTQIRAPQTAVAGSDLQKSPRRHSGSSSTVSSFYSSMHSEASSQQPSTVGSNKSAQFSNKSVVTQASSLDLISVGSNRSSRELPSGLANHLHTVHARVVTAQHLANTSNLVVQTQDEFLMSETEEINSGPQPNCMSVQGAGGMNPPHSMSPAGMAGRRFHPNHNVRLDALEEGKPFEENKNVFVPDELVSYLNTVAEHGSSRPGSVVSEAITSVSQYVPPPSNVNIPCQSPRGSCDNHAPPYQKCSSNSSQNWSSCNPCCQTHHNPSMAFNNTNGTAQNQQPCFSNAGNHQTVTNCAAPIKSASPLSNCANLVVSANMNHQVPFNQNMVPCQTNVPQTYKSAPNYNQNPIQNNVGGNCYPQNSFGQTSGNVPPLSSYSESQPYNSGQPNSATSYSQHNGQLNCVPYSQNNGQANSVPPFTQNNGQPNSVPSFTQNNGQPNVVPPFTQNNGHPNSMPSFTPNNGQSNCVPYSQNNGQSNSVPPYAQNNGQPNSVPPYAQSNGQPNSVPSYSQNNYDYVQNQSTAANAYSGNAHQAYGHVNQQASFPSQGGIQSQNYGPHVNNQTPHCAPPSYPTSNSINPNMPKLNMAQSSQSQVNMNNQFVAGNSNLQVIQSQDNLMPMNSSQNSYPMNGWDRNSPQNMPYNPGQNMYQSGQNQSYSPNLNYQQQNYNMNSTPACHANQNYAENQNNSYNYNQAQPYNPNQSQPYGANQNSYNNQNQYYQNNSFSNGPIAMSYSPENPMAAVNNMPYGNMSPNSVQAMNMAISQSCNSQQPATVNGHCNNYNSGQYSTANSAAPPPQYPAQMQPPPPPQYPMSNVSYQAQMSNLSLTNHNVSQHGSSCCSHKPSSSLQAQCSVSSGVSELDEKSSVSARGARGCSVVTQREIQCQNVSQSSLSVEAYQRTLKYVQQCQEIHKNKPQPSPGCNRVSSSTDRRSPSNRSPLSQTQNMVINDLSGGLRSLVEENKCFQVNPHQQL